MTRMQTYLLLEALRASGDKIRPQPIIRKVIVPNGDDAFGVDTVAQMIELQGAVLTKLTSEDVWLITERLKETFGLLTFTKFSV